METLRGVRANQLVAAFQLAALIVENHERATLARAPKVICFSDCAPALRDARAKQALDEFFAHHDAELFGGAVPPSLRIVDVTGNVVSLAKPGTEWGDRVKSAPRARKPRQKAKIINFPGRG